MVVFPVSLRSGSKELLERIVVKEKEEFLPATAAEMLFHSVEMVDMRWSTYPYSFPDPLVDPGRYVFRRPQRLGLFCVPEVREMPPRLGAHPAPGPPSRLGGPP
jgi:hypothetical protein